MARPLRRQAVLLIHGIGEQRPMSTLRGFVAALVGDNYRSKPDDLSRSFELRRLVHEDRDRAVMTCFFEYYWAYRLRDTTHRHVLDWARRLLAIPPWRAEIRRLLPLWILAWIAIALGFLLLSYYFLSTLEPESRSTHHVPWGTVLSLALAAASGFWLYWVGDAARYLNSAPSNVAERHAIRTEGVRLLRGLHEATVNGRPAYDRILIVGHSLGSVIGHDILKYYWNEINEEIPVAAGAEAEASLHALLQSGRALTHRAESVENDHEVHAFQRCQEALLAALGKGGPWRVSDFVTLGSPLTHAGFLLADSYDDLAQRIRQRELPACPPIEDQEDGGYAFATQDEAGQVLGFTLHHAALFAVTKWTNLYFPGDVIGGRIGSCLGRGVREVECEFGKGDKLLAPLPWPRRSRRFWSHVLYWEPRWAPTSLAELKRLILSWPLNEPAE